MGVLEVLPSANESANRLTSHAWDGKGNGREGGDGVFCVFTGKIK